MSEESKMKKDIATLARESALHDISEGLQTIMYCMQNLEPVMDNYLNVLNGLKNIISKFEAIADEMSDESGKRKIEKCIEEAYAILGDKEESASQIECYFPDVDDVVTYIEELLKLESELKELSNE